MLRIRNKTDQSGQALVEALVACIALVPLLILAIYLAKVQTLQTSALAASRAFAFECQVAYEQCAALNNGTNSVIVEELRRRFFMRTNAAITSNETADDSAAMSEKQSLWKSHRGQVFLETYGDIGFRVDPDTFNAGSGIVGARGSHIANNAMNIVSTIAGPARFGLDWQGGLMNTRIEARLNKANAVDALLTSLNGSPLVMRVNTATLTDAWSASSTLGGEGSSTKTRVEAGSKLPLLEAGFDIAYLPTRASILIARDNQLEPLGGAFRYHEVDMDIVPIDRLGGAPQ